MAKKNEDGLRGKCICARCPTYNDCMRKGNELLFCLETKSPCKMEKFGCICPSCPVQAAKGFSGVYFCEKGKVQQ